MKQQAVVVGSGVIGMSLAYELAQRDWQVTLLDRQAVGREASWAGAGILPAANAATAHHPLDQLAGLSVTLHARWAEQLRSETGIDTGYRPCGAIYLAQSAGESAALYGQAELWRAEQVDAEPLSNLQLAQVEPALATSVGKIRAAYWVPGEAQLRNPRHLAALAQACRQRGVIVREQSEVLGFEAVGERLIAVRTEQGLVPGDAFVLTAGAWTQRLLGELRIENGILPIRGQMILFRCATPPFRRILAEGPRYLVARDDGYVLAGSTEEDVGFDKTTTEQGLADLRSFAVGLVPALAEATIEQTWAGLRPGTYDGLPYLGPLPGLANAFVAAGHFRSGLYLSPATAQVMACLLEHERPPIDLSLFRVARG